MRCSPINLAVRRGNVQDPRPCHEIPCLPDPGVSLWICDWSTNTNGLIQTHFITASHDHGRPTTTASGLVSRISILDIIGVIASGWPTDRVRPWLLMIVYYGLRGLSALTVHTPLGPTVEPALWIFLLFYGLDWVATAPPTVVLCRKYFTPVRATVVFGWVFAVHISRHRSRRADSRHWPRHLRQLPDGLDNRCAPLLPGGRQPVLPTKVAEGVRYVQAG